MRLVFDMDIQNGSRSESHTPSMVAQQLPFRIFNSGHFFASKNYYTIREGLENYLLIYTVRGEGYLKYLGKEYTLRANQVFIIDCMNEHHYKTGIEEFWEIKWMHFSGNACNTYYNLINDDAFNIVTLSDPFAAIKYLDDILEIMQKNTMLADVRISECITCVLTELYANRLNPTDNVKNDSHQKMVDTVISHIQSKFHERLSIDQLLEHIHLSKFHFLRTFKKYTGISPYEYIINFRIGQSKDLLKKTELSIEEIAYSVGFKNVNNYIRDFKKVAGTTPLRYKKFWITR